MTKELIENKQYNIDWSNVETLEDIKLILKSLKITFTQNKEQGYDWSNIKQFLKEVNNK